MKISRQLASCLFLSVLASLASCSRQAGEITVSGPWVAEAPPTSKVMVGYLVLSNSTAEPVTFTTASSENFSSIEFHETVHEDGMARMVRHEALVVPANDQLVLQRGGQHLMLFNPTRVFKAGDRITITLVEDDNSETEIAFDVKRSGF